MPFRSTAQQRWAFATGQPFADRWAKVTDFAKLPKYVQRRRKQAEVCTCKATGAPGEKLGPGVTRIRGNLCNVHGRYGPCDAGASKKPVKGRKPAKPAKPKQTPEQRAQARQQQRQQNFDAVAKRMADSDAGLSPSGTKALLAFSQGQQPDARMGEGLARMGLAERAEDGSYRMTPTGRAVVSAMQSGDYQRAVDTISRGTDAASARRGRQAAQQGRQQAAAQRRADVEARRQQRAQERAQRQAEQAKRGSGGGKKQPEQRAEQTQRPRPIKRPSRGAAANSGPSSSGGSKPKPKPAEAAPAKTEPQIAPALQQAAQALSEGAEVSDEDIQKLITNGLVKLNRDGEPVLTAAGQRATKKETSGHTGVMVALYPDAAAARAIASQDNVTESIEGLHLTLAFLGDSSETALATNKDKVIAAVKEWAAAHGQPLEGTINGLGRFFHSEDDNTNAVYVSPDVPGLPELRQSLVEWIEQSGFDYAQNHGFTPHITVAYVPIDAPTPPIRIETPVRFDQVTLAWGDERYDYPLGAVQKDFSLSVFKDASGGDRWLLVSSTAYRDRDKEIVSTQALKGAVEQADASGMRGPLRFWHVPGLDLGDCDFQATAQDGRFLIESGTFRSPALAAAVKAHADEYQVSIGFLHPATEPDADGVYRNITIFERSLVPRGRAANPLTRVVITKELRMLTPEKETALKGLLGGDQSLLSDLLGNVATTDKAAQDAGATYKDDLRALIREELASLLTEKAAPTAEVAPPDEPPAMEAKADMAEVADAVADEVADEATEDAMDYLGDMSVADFQALLSQAFTEAIAPLVKSLDIAGKMAGHMDELKGMIGGYTAQKDSALAETKAELETVKAQVADLSGSAPRILAGGYRASQSPTTVTTDETKIKEAGPAADPKAAAFGAFMQDLGFTGPAQI